MPENKDKKDTSWEGVAGWYDKMLAEDDTYQAKVVLPNLLRLISPKNKKILDIACGQGFFSKVFALQGAEVLGVDLSPQLIKIATAEKVRGSRFEVSAADDITVAADDSFDAAVIVLALQNIKEMPETIKEAYRALRKGGTLVIVLNHPCFRILRASSWEFDMNTCVQYRRIEKYNSSFSANIDMTPGTRIASQKVFTVTFHRALQDYFKALVNSGFVVTGLEEWISHKKSDPGPRSEAEDTARKEFPMFLTLVAKK